jgi:hypothetical protein
LIKVNNSFALYKAKFPDSRRTFCRQFFLSLQYITLNSSYSYLSRIVLILSGEFFTHLVVEYYFVVESAIVEASAPSFEKAA